MLSAGFSSSRPAGTSTRALQILLLCFIAFTASHSSAQQTPSPTPAGFNAIGIGTGSRTIDGVWQFHIGDDPQWAQPGFDDSKWEQLPADQPWGDAGHPGYTGFAWYRRQIALDPTDRKPLALYLPPLNSVAEVYWNGVKVGGIGTPPPNASWYFNQQPVAVPLPLTPGATSATLAIRLWDHFPTSNDASDSSGFFASPQFGYAPLIQKMKVSWVDHRLRTHALPYAVTIIFFCVTVAAFILWLRSPAQWVLLCVALYSCSRVCETCVQFLPAGWTGAITCNQLMSSLEDSSLLFLIFLVADLPPRPGIKGYQFWKWVCLVCVFMDVVSSVLSAWEVLIITSPNRALFQLLDKTSELVSFVPIAIMPILLIACLLLSKPRLSRILFMAATALVLFIADVFAVAVNDLTRYDTLLAFLGRPLADFYGSTFGISTAARLFLLCAIVYAVWDHLSAQRKRQRFVDAELRAAQEIQRVLVAAPERDAPGYAIESVYRPASEVGGDFFQVIPLTDDTTLIVAGDVSGKGLRAAMTVSLVVGAVRTLAEQDSSPAAVLAGLNRRLIDRTHGGFVTCCIVRVDPTGHAAMANAGHCQPFLDSNEMELPANLPLGIVADLTYEEITVDLSHGQQLTLMSDGVVEARNQRGELYGFGRLMQLMQNRPTAEHVANTAIDFGQDDDITVLTVTRLSTA